MEVSIGDITAKLKLEASEWQRGIQTAIQSLAQFQQQLQSGVTPAQQTLQQLLTQLTSTQNTQTQSTNQLATAYIAMAQAVQQQTQAYAQAQAASLAYTRQQDALREALRQQREEQQAATDAARHAGSVWERTLSVAGGFGIITAFHEIGSALRSAFDTLVEFGTSVVDVGQKMQGLQLAFRGLGGSAQSGAADFAFITRESQRLGLDLTTAATTFRNFEAAAKGTALEGQQARDIFTAVAQAARVLGVQGQDLQRVFLAVDRMMQTNVINARELRLQLGTALPGSIEILARALGITTQQLFEMTKHGTLLATEALPALARGLREELGGSVADVGTLASTAFARLGNEIVLLKERIAQSGVLQFVRDLTESAAGLLETGRKAGEARLKEAGGTPPAVPAQLQGLSPGLDARQQEIARLQASLLPQSIGAMLQAAGMPDLGTTPLTDKDRQAVRERIQQLIAEQQQAIQRVSSGLVAEGGPGATGASPVTAAEDRILALMEEGRKRLSQIDLNAAFLPELDVAQEKLKAWEQTLKKIREEFDKLSEPLRQSFSGTTGTPSPYRALIGPLAAARGVDPNLIEALVAQESSNTPTAVSPVGAKGLGQFMPDTAAHYGIAGREFEPEANLRATVNYLADLLKMFSGDVVKALTAYNAGPGHGGIPLATGENATFAQDVLRRIPSGPAGLYAQASAQETALRGAVEANKPDSERLAQIRATGREYLHGIDEEMRQAEHDDKERLTQARATGRAYLEAIDHEIHANNQAIEGLRRLAAQYTQTKDARDEDKAATLASKLAQTQYAEEAIALAKTVDDSTKVLAQVPRLRAEAASSALAFTQSQTSAQTVQQLRNRLEQLQVSRGTEAFPFGPTREDVKLRQHEDLTITTPADRDAADRVRAQIHAQQQLNYAVQVFEQFGTSVGSAWTNSLLSIADGTKTVAGAFRDMARSILQSIIQITSQEAWKALIGLGVRVITNAAVGGIAGGGVATQYSSTIGPTIEGGFLGAQGGAIINRPTTVLAGENPQMNPEYILNRPQMHALMQSAVRAAPSAGGQAAGAPPITIINVGSRREAEQQKGQQEALGRKVVINYVLDELAKGEGSSLNRAMRTLQR